MKWIKLLTVNILLFLAIFAIVEITTRIIAPEYKNAYFTKDVTWGQPIYRNTRWGHRVGLDQVNKSLTRESPTQHRILFVGDSVTFGYGVRYEDTYHSVAERLLRQHGCDTYVHGFGLLHSNLKIQINSEFHDFIMDGFDANLVIYQFNANDVPIISEITHAVEGNLTFKQKLEMFRVSYINRSAFMKSIQSISSRNRLRGKNMDLRDDIKFHPRSNPELFQRGWQVFEEDVATIQQLLKKKGADFWILLSPESFEISSSMLDNEFRIDISGIKEWPGDRVKAIAAKYNIPVLNTLSALKDYRKENTNIRLYLPSDASHPTAIGHNVVGEEVARVLRSSPLTCPGHGVSDTTPSNGLNKKTAERL
jgi:hypothetical protein